jgi:hypothetical protein
MPLARAEQMTFFEWDSRYCSFGNLEEQEWGTFKESLSAPIQSWFTYPAGFSCKAVEASFALIKLTKEIAFMIHLWVQGR